MERGSSSGGEVAIVGVGGRSPTGLNALQVAMTARAMRLAPAESHLVDARGDAIATARLASIGDRLYGLARLVALGAPALAEAARPLARAGVLPRGGVSLFLALPEPSTAGGPACAVGRDRDALTELAEAAAITIALDRSTVVRRGRAGGVLAFELAARAIATGACKVALVGGVDSAFDPDVLERLDAERRLHSMGTENGVIPGEGAAFLALAATRLLTDSMQGSGDLSPLEPGSPKALIQEAPRSRRERADGLHVQGVCPAVCRRTGEMRPTRLGTIVSTAFEIEPRPWGGDEPCLGAGITRAVKRAASAAGALDRPLPWALTDVANERHRVDEWVYATTRAHRAFDEAFVDEQPLLEVGELGAASAAMLAAIAVVRWQAGCAHGDRVLIAVHSDGAERGAMVLEAPRHDSPVGLPARGSESRRTSAGFASRGSGPRDAPESGARTDTAEWPSCGERKQQARAARMARREIESALFAITTALPGPEGKAPSTKLARALALVHASLDATAGTPSQGDPLNVAGALVEDVRRGLVGQGDAGSVRLRPLRRGLALAASALRAAVAASQRAREARREDRPRRRSAPSEGGGLWSGAGFCASVGVPSLHRIPRAPLAPPIPLRVPDEASAQVARSGESAGARARAVRLGPPRPRSFEALAALAGEVRAAAAAETGAFASPSQSPAGARATIETAELASPSQSPAGARGGPREAASRKAPPTEADVVERLARDCLEDIAHHRILRTPNAIESWLDQAPFEQRLLDQLDALASLGERALPVVSRYLAEARVPDPERAFAAALSLGCVAGADTAAAAIAMLRQSEVETYDGWREGLSLASSDEIDRLLIELLGSTSASASLVALALDVLYARGTTVPAAALREVLGRSEPGVAARVARALATCLDGDEAVAWLEQQAETAFDDALFIAATESLLRRGSPRARALLRTAVVDAGRTARAQAAAVLLCLVGSADDLELLVESVRARPTPALVRGLGRFGHPGAIGALLAWLAHEGCAIRQAAAEALERITGAGLREVVHEPWVPLDAVDLPDGDSWVAPMRRVERPSSDAAAWRDWLCRNEARLSGRAPASGRRPRGGATKLRGGVAFVPVRIVEELEASETPPARRVEAARELSLHLGRPVPFSPSDWVARQKAHLAALREVASRVDAPPGAFTPLACAPGARGRFGARGGGGHADHGETVTAPAVALTPPSALAVLPFRGGWPNAENTAPPPGGVRLSQPCRFRG